MSNELEAQTRNHQMECSFIPDDVFEHHIWKHFSFNTWISVFSLVCKRWKLICEESTVDPKQVFLQIDHKIEEVGLIVEMIKKYQPTIICAHLASQVEDKFLVHRMCDASKKLHTLVLRCLYEFDMYVKPIKNVTTLALKVGSSDKFWEDLQEIFPNLTHLLIEDPPTQIAPVVDHLTYIIQKYRSGNFLAQPDLTINQMQGQIATKLMDDQPLQTREISYEEYFRYFGITKLLEALRGRKFVDASDLLDSGITTMAYERALYDANTHYKYPSSVSIGFFDPKVYWSTFIGCEWAYNLFVPTNKIPMPDSQKFIALSEFKRKKEALLVFRKLDDKSLASDEVFNAFFDDFLPLLKKSDLNLKGVYERATRIVQSTDLEYITVENFDKISELRDWSDHFAITEDVEICLAMVKKGCKIDAEKFRDLANKEDVDSIVELVANQHPSNLFNVLVDYPFKKLKNIANKYNIDLTMEQDGESLFNGRIRSSVVHKEELAEYNHLSNHMDSNGNTPLLVAMGLPLDNIWGIVKMLLELGADPTKHRGDKLSPLGMILSQSLGQTVHYVTNAIHILIEYGADVNAPCLFEERMCSPLMIAVQCLLDDDIIRLLVLLGARTDYVDETGRTIKECADDRYSFLDRYNSK